MWYIALVMSVDARPARAKLPEATHFRVIAEGVRHFGQPIEIVTFKGQQVNGFTIGRPFSPVSPGSVGRADLSFFPGEQIVGADKGILLLTRQKYGFHLPSEGDSVV